MKAIHIVLGSLLLSSMALAQTNGRDPNSPSSNDTGLATEVQALREALSQTQKQLAAQQLEIQTLKAKSQTAPVAPATDGQAPAQTEPTDLTSYGEARALNTDQQLRAQQGGKAEKSPTGYFRFDGSVLELG